MKWLLAILFSFAALAAQAQKPAPKFVLRGVVTYFFNNNYGYKPDVGAKAYIIKAQDAQSLHVNPLVIGQYKQAFEKMDQMMASDAAEVLPGEDDPRQTLQRLDKEAAQVRAIIVGSQLSSKVSIDATGAFSKSLPAGIYYLLVVSANRSHKSQCEQLGQIDLQKVVIKDENVEVSTQFGL